jgi:hypothetical protein
MLRRGHDIVLVHDNPLLGRPDVTAARRADDAEVSAEVLWTGGVRLPAAEGEQQDGFVQ